MLNTFLKNVIQKFKKKDPENWYHGYYLFGKYADKPIWDWSVWKACLPLIEPVINLSPETPSITTTQAIPVAHENNSQLVSYNKGALRFGKMMYNNTNNEKWTTKYANEPNRMFFDTEIVFPSFSYCEKHNVDPEIFIKITNENTTGSAHAQINQSLIMLFKTNLTGTKQLQTIEQHIEALNDKLHVVLSGKIIRPSIYPAEFDTFTDYIRNGSHGVVDYETADFSERFKQYGMQTIKKVIG